MSDYSEKSFEISSNNITITNNDKLEVVPDQKINIRVNGKPANLEKINAGKIYAEINAKDIKDNFIKYKNDCEFDEYSIYCYGQSLIHI